MACIWLPDVRAMHFKRLLRVNSVIILFRAGSTMSNEMSASVMTDDDDTDVTGTHKLSPFSPLVVAAGANDYRTKANYWALFELAELKDYHRRQVDEIKRSFRFCITSSANRNSGRRRSSSSDIDPGSLTTTDDAEVSSGEGEEENRKSSMTHDRRFSQNLLPDVQYRLPVCFRGQTANYPSPLHAILAQYAEVAPLPAAANNVAVCEVGTLGDDGSSQQEYASPPSGRCDNDTTHSSATSEGISDRLLSSAIVERPAIGSATTQPPLNRRLAEVRRSASSASCSSSEGYCSGTETDSAAECTCPRSTNTAGPCRCDRDVDVDVDVDRLRRTDEEDCAATAALTRLMSSVANVKDASCVRRTLSNRKTKRRICKASRRLSPLTLGDDDVFVRYPLGIQQNVIFVWKVFI